MKRKIEEPRTTRTMRTGRRVQTPAWLVLAGAILMWLALNHVWAGGACTAARFHAWQDTGCDPNFAGAGQITASQSCACANLPPAHGMPQWWVSEPYLSLALADTPLSYTMSSGKEMNFTFRYNQRVSLPEPDETQITSNEVQETGTQYPQGPNCGASAFWGCNWNMSVVIMAMGPARTPAFSQGYYSMVFHPEGNIDLYTNGPAPAGANPHTQVTLTDNSGGMGYPIVSEQDIYNQGLYNNAPTADTNGIYWGNTNIGVKLLYPDGAQDIFALSAQSISAFIAVPQWITVNSNPVVRLLLTQRIDPEGRVTQLGYENYYDLLPELHYRVKYVVDPDSRTNQFHYTATTNLQVAEIDDPYGRKTTLGYNSDGTLNHIVDAAGLTTSFQYPPSQVTATLYYASDSNDVVQGITYTTVPSSGWISQMTTPYGTNQFLYYEVDDSTVTDGVQQRAVYASEPQGAGQLYYYLHKNSSLPNTDTAPVVPGITNFDDGNAGGISGHKALYYRNTFHWGRRQFDALIDGNSTFSTDIGQALLLQNLQPGNSATYFSNALAVLSTNDLNKAELKHWLWQADNTSISGSVSSERAPSFDTAGQYPGSRTWYNYTGKPAGGAEDLGSNPQIACVAKVLPGTNSQYTLCNFYPQGMRGSGLVSDRETSYSLPGGSLGELTNWFTYAANSVDLISVSNSAGQYINYGYNGGHQIIAMTNALNQVAIQSWDPSTRNLAGIQWPSGESINFGYYNPATPPTATSSLLQWETLQPEGRCFTNNSFYAGLPTSITDDRGVTLQKTWDGLNRLTSTVFPDNTTISNVYNRLDLVASKDRLNNWTYFACDGLQHLTNVVNANGAATTYEWCGCGSLSEILDPQNGGNNPTSLNYDNQGNLLNVTLPDGSSRNWQYDLVGRMTNFVDGSGLRFLRVAYNNQGLPVTVTSANGTVQSTVYDALNRPVSITDANGVTVTNTFDAINELVKRTWPDGLGEGFAFATNGLVAYTNRDGKTTVYGRDTAGRLTAETNANHEVTQFAYDSLDHITSLLDGNNHQTLWQYNQYGWLTNKIDGLGRNAFRWQFNPNGWVTNRWTPEKGNTAYTYDGVGNLMSILYPQSSILYAYDGLNRRTNMVDLAGNHAFTWTPASQMASERDGWATNFWGYSQGLRIGLTNVEAGGNWIQTYSYDDGWRLQAVLSPAGNFGYGYNLGSASPLVTGISLPNGANIVNSYDSLARLRQTGLNNYWGHALDSYTYTADPLGLRTNIVRGLGLTTNTVNVGFDPIGQLIGWSAAEPGGALRQNEQLEFAYDPAHNLHARTNGALAQTFTTDAANQLNTVARTGPLTLSGATPAPAASVTVNGQSAQIYGDFTFAGTNLALANGQNTIITNIAVNLHGLTVTNLLSVNLPSSVALLYDNNGNLTNDGARSFGYDCENQLTNVYVSGQWRSDFIYDGLNRRRIERDYIWSGSTWTKTSEIHLIYDGNLLIQERDTNNNVLVTYTRGLDMAGSLSGAGGIGGLLARTDPNGSTFYHADGGGNITALIDGSENIVARYAYGPFGKPIGKWGTMADANEMRFSSMPYYSNPQIYGYWGRFYDPNLQRWPNQDPIGEQGGLNLYRFVGNNPVNEIDPLGLRLSDYNPFSGEAWAQLLHDKLIGDNAGTGPFDPNSNLALSQNAGLGFQPLTDANGNQLGNPASAIAGNVANSLFNAATMMTPMGEGEGAFGAAGKLAKLRKCEQAAAGAARLLRPNEGVIGFMRRDGSLIGDLANLAKGHEDLASQLNVTKAATDSGGVIAFTATKSSDGTIGVFGSGVFPFPGGVLPDGFKQMILKFVK